MFKKKRKIAELNLVGDAPLPPKVRTEIEVAVDLTKIRALADEARVHLERLQVIKKTIAELGGEIAIHAQPVIYYVGIGTRDTTPAWKVEVTHKVTL